MIRRSVAAGIVGAALALSASAGAGAAAAGTTKGDDVATLRTATATFQDLQQAEDAGYGFFTDTAGIACIAMPGMGGMGVHFVKGSLVADPTEAVPTPEALVYRIDADGKLVLAAVEYVVIAGAWDETHAAPPRLFGHTFALTAAGNRYGLPAYYSLHAWVWYHNPAGMFAPYNPRVHC